MNLHLHSLVLLHKDVFVQEAFRYNEFRAPSKFIPLMLNYDTTAVVMGHAEINDNEKYYLVLTANTNLSWFERFYWVHNDDIVDCLVICANAERYDCELDKTR